MVELRYFCYVFILLVSVVFSQWITQKKSHKQAIVSINFLPIYPILNYTIHEHLYSYRISLTLSNRALRVD